MELERERKRNYEDIKLTGKSGSYCYIFMIIRLHDKSVAGVRAVIL